MALADLKYVTTGAWGTGIARPLTAAEADGNVQTLRAAIQDLIDNPVEGVSVTNIAVSGRQVTFYMSDSSTYGPFLLPIAYPRYRGEWAAAYSYAAMDIVQVPGYGTYLVAVDHTSEATFNPDAADTSGSYYVQIAADANAYPQVTTVSGTTLALDTTYAAKYIRCTNAAGCAVTLDAGAYATNTEIHFRQCAAGGITITAGAGVAINAPPGKDTATDAQGSVLTLKNIGGDDWDIFGNLMDSA